MLRRTAVVLIGSAVVISAAVMSTARAAEPLPAREAWVSPDALLVLQVHDPQPLLDLLLAPDTVAAVKASPVYQAPQTQQGLKQLQAAVGFLEARLDTKWPEALAKLLGGGMTLALGPNGTPLLIVDAKDGEMLEELHDVLLFFAKADAEKKGNPDRVSSGEYRGVTGWKLGPNQVHAILGNRLLVSNNADGLKAAADLRAQPDQPTLAGLPAFQKAIESARSGAVATLYVNTGVLKNAPKVRAALEQDRNPLGVLLLAGLAEAVQESTWLALSLERNNETLVLRLATDGTLGTSGTAGFATPPEAGGGAMPNLAVPRRIAAVSLYRDLHGFYAAKDELFPERTSGLIFFENMMGIFFTGRDLTEEVLAETGPEVRLVVAEQEYDPAIGKPNPQVPSFAVVFRMKNPKKFSRIAEEAWQKAVGLINFTRGQQAQPGLIIDRPTHAGVKYTSAYFAAPDEDADKPATADVRFNFSPSLAMPGEYLIFSSTGALAEDLIDAITAETKQGAGPVAGSHSLVDVDAAQLASILAANRESMVRNNMVEKGNTRQQAEGEIGVLLTIAKYVGQVKLELGTEENQTRAALEVKLNLKP